MEKPGALYITAQDAAKICGFEQTLSGFKKYSFGNYNQLKIINAYLQSYIAKVKPSTAEPVLLDMLHEIDNEMLLLHELRLSADKNTEFHQRVQSTTAISRQLISYLQISPAIEGKKRSIWSWFTRS